MGLGVAELKYFLHLRITADTRCLTTHLDSGDIPLLEKLLNHLQIQDIATLSFPRRFESQQGIPEIFFYFEGCWCSKYFFRLVEPPR